MYLSGNFTIPPTFGSLTNLENLDLRPYYGQQIPSEIAQLTNLKSLYIYSSTGNIPFSIGGLTKLAFLYLHGIVTSSSTSTLGNLTNLDTLSLEENECTESLAASMESLTRLTYLRLSNYK
jgi:Leucine-rich repeat (LRR) protein